MQGVDWNSDGNIDIIYSDTYRRTYLLLNDGNDKDRPTFTQQKFFDMEKKNHGMHAGGGDWNNDGVSDFLHMPFGGGSYKLFKGMPGLNGALKFQEGGLKQCTVLKIGRDRETKAIKCAWAWNYSGTAKKRGVIEYVGIAKNRKDICFFELKGGESKLVAKIHTPDGQTPLLTAGDINQDGKMDILFSCGLWNNEKKKTKIWVMYGKVANMPGAKKAAKKDETKKASVKPAALKAKPVVDKKEKDAKRYFQLAASMRRARNFDGAKTYYSKVVADYADTSWAAKAKKALTKLR